MAGGYKAERTPMFGERPVIVEPEEEDNAYRDSGFIWGVKAEDSDDDDAREGLASGIPRETRGVKKDAVITHHTTSDFVAKHYSTVRELGTGSFGRVTLVQERKSGQERVCKTISTRDMDVSTLEMMRKEIQLLAMLDHPHVVKLYEFADDEVRGEFVLIMEYLCGEDCLALCGRAEQRGRVLDEGLVARIANHILLALCYCHSQGVLHRDIKPENVMLSAQPASSADLVDCKIIDFGMAVRRDRPLREVCGTPAYIAPEVLARLMGYDSKADIWSAGVTVLELLTGVKPFGDPNDHDGDLQPVLQAITHFRSWDTLERRLAGSPGWNSSLRTKESRDFVKQLMSIDPRQRPSAAEALHHPFLTKHREAPKAMTAEMIKSLAGYNEAPPIMRCCLYIVAARQGVQDLPLIGAAFKTIDADGDGKISRGDLEAAVQSASSWWDPTVNVERVLDAADLDHTGGLNFTQFVAACLYARHAKQGSLDELMRRAFDALDDDRDGKVTLEDIYPLFRERDVPLLKQLPQDRPFDMEEWLACLDNVGHTGVSGPGPLAGLPSLDQLLGRVVKL